MLSGVVALGCGGPGQPKDQLGLQAALLSSPQDREARLALAALAIREGRPAQALREYLILERRGELDGEARQSLSRLLMERGTLRLEAGDSLAVKDLEHSRALGQDAKDREEVWFDAHSLAAASALRHSSAFERDRAPQILLSLGSGTHATLRQGFSDLETKSLAELLALQKWLDAANAKRQVLRILQSYVDKGGRDIDAVSRWHHLHHWWFGDTRPALPSDVADTVPLPDAGERLRQTTRSVENVLNPTGAPLALMSWVDGEFLKDAERIVHSYRKDPSLADRVAKRFVDGDVYGAVRMSIVSELFYRLGDMRRAKEWTDEIGALNPDVPRYAMSASLGCAAHGDIDRAVQWVVRGAAASGDPGHWWAVAAIGFRQFGHPLAAIAAGRLALDLTSSGEDLHILLELSSAQRTFGRKEDARRTMSELQKGLAESDRNPRTSANVSSLDGEVLQRPKSLLGPIGL